MIMEIMAKKSCPDEEIIADYLEGRLSPEEEEGLDAHLSKCEVCLEEFMIGDKALKDSAEPPAVPSSVTEAAVHLLKKRAGVRGPNREVTEKNLKEFLADCVEKISALFRYPLPWRLQPATIRSLNRAATPDRGIRRVVFPEIQAEIEIERTGAEKADIRVRFAEAKKNGIRVTLKKGERDISSLLLSAGYALFEDIPFGRHDDIIFSSGGSEFGYYTFEIRESRNG